MTLFKVANKNPTNNLPTVVSNICATLTLAQSTNSLVALNTVFKLIGCQIGKQYEHFPNETGTRQTMSGVRGW